MFFAPLSALSTFLKFAMWTAIATCLAVTIAPGALAATNLKPEERAHLRFKLERVFYEQDLLVRNHKVDRADLKQQETEFQTLKIYERIPFREDLPGLRDSLTDSSRFHGLKITSFKPLKKTRGKATPLPAVLYTDQTQNYRMTEDQLVERIPFEVAVQGERSQVDAWIRSWPEDQMRLAQLENVRSGKTSAAKNVWLVRAQAFRFKEVKFPTLEPRDPMELLPLWAQNNPASFADDEPVLWSYVARTQAINPKARPLYRLRERMQLNAQRLSFFISLAAPRR